MVEHCNTSVAKKINTSVVVHAVSIVTAFNCAAFGARPDYQGQRESQISVDVSGHARKVLLSAHGDDFQLAVCSTGHFRTFGLPGMYSSLVKNLLNTANTDLYLVGHFGAYKNTKGVEDGINPRSQHDLSLNTALDFLGAHTRAGVHIYVGAGDCHELEAAWKADGIFNRICRGNGRYGDFMQIMWIDHCIHLVRQSGKKYDLLVRTRPDIGVFAPMPWAHINRSRVCFMSKDTGGRADWFFTVPWSSIDTWWEDVVSFYLSAPLPLPHPNYTIFFDRKEFHWGKGYAREEVQFPVVIVRGPFKADCFRLVAPAAFDYKKDCEKKADSGYFERLPTSGHQPANAVTLRMRSPTSGNQPAKRYSANAVTNQRHPFTLTGRALIYFFFIMALLSVIGIAAPEYMAGPMYLGTSVCIDCCIAMSHLEAPTDIAFAYNPFCPIILVELGKLVVSAVLLGAIRHSSMGATPASIPTKDSAKALSMMACPAFFFTLNNILVFLAIGKNEMSTFAAFRETMILWTALIWTLVFNEALGWRRKVAVVTVVFGLVLNQVPSLMHASFSCMVFLVCLMALANACGSVSNEYVLKMSNLDLNLQNIFLYGWCLLLSIIALAISDHRRLLSRTEFFRGFNSITYIIVSLQLIAGLFVSRILKYSSSIVKNMIAALRSPILVILSVPLRLQSKSDPLWLLSAVVVGASSSFFLMQGKPA